MIAVNIDGETVTGLWRKHTRLLLSGDKNKGTLNLHNVWYNSKEVNFSVIFRTRNVLHKNEVHTASYTLASSCSKPLDVQLFATKWM